MIKSLLNQHALITGGSRGIGFEIATRLSALGCKITLLSRTEKDLRNRVNQLNKTCPLENKKHDFIKYDLSKPIGLESFIKKEFTDYKSVNILINCAGISQQKLLINTPEDEIVKITHVNLLSPMILSKLFARSMMRLDNSNIINVSSILAQNGMEVIGASVYTVTKSGLNKFTVSLAKEMERKKGHIVKVNSVMPGLIRETEIGGTVDISKMTIDNIIDIESSKTKVADEIVKILQSRDINGECIIC